MSSENTPPITRYLMDDVLLAENDDFRSLVANQQILAAGGRGRPAGTATDAC